MSRKSLRYMQRRMHTLQQEDKLEFRLTQIKGGKTGVGLPKAWKPLIRCAALNSHRTSVALSFWLQTSNSVL